MITFVLCDSCRIEIQRKHPEWKFEKVEEPWEVPPNSKP